MPRAAVDIGHAELDRLLEGIALALAVLAGAGSASAEEVRSTRAGGCEASERP